MRWLLVAVLLASCSSLNPVGLLTGGGTNVAANTQLGKENKQAVVTYEEETTTSAGRDVITTEVIKEVEAGPVEELKINNTNIPPWVLLVLLLGWLLPTPSQMGRAMYNFVAAPFKRKTVKDRMNGY
jgi:hypothetical protein